MKKIIIAVIVVVVIAGGAIVMANKQDKTTDNNIGESTKTSSSETKKAKAACELLTLEDAKTLLGSNATLAEGSGAPNLATTEDMSVDNCTYSADGDTLGDLKQITIQRQSGDSGQVKQAYENYKKEFPGETVTGLGDTAYYVTGSEQVQVLKGDYWLHIAGGSINAGDAGNKELIIKAAETALEKL